jgi:Leucine-rich repeat (LRR) protein
MESFNKKWVKKYIQLLEDINLEDNYIMENFNLKNLKLNKKFISDVSIKIV